MIGAYIGWLNWQMAVGRIQATILKKQEAGQTVPLWLVKHENHLRGILLVALMGGIALIGYWAGAAL
ncbi:hypothetical protein E1162_05455 [Rhodobacteraceae bacterium RKSG542]|uniref:hypothetical protein n=1 Tax=Pseudovibrio flavus TaxID=2529854 RepID=UPI0012BB4C70|nr:hypothetical protein [Pseudovibrio flavus]MTI16685.1 hypothetical protein [Pseudovibrio flavus]